MLHERRSEPFTYENSRGLLQRSCYAAWTGLHVARSDVCMCFAFALYGALRPFILEYSKRIIFEQADCRLDSIFPLSKAITLD